MIGKTLFGSVAVFLLVVYFFTQSGFRFVNSQVTGFESVILQIQSNFSFGIAIFLFLSWAIFYYIFQKRYTLGNGIQIAHFLPNLFAIIYLSSPVFYFEIKFLALSGFSRRYYSFSYSEEYIELMTKDINAQITITLMVLVALQLLFVGVIWFGKK